MVKRNSLFYRYFCRTARGRLADPGALCRVSRPRRGLSQRRRTMQRRSGRSRETRERAPSGRTTCFGANARLSDTERATSERCPSSKSCRVARRGPTRPGRVPPDRDRGPIWAVPAPSAILSAGLQRGIPRCRSVGKVPSRAPRAESAKEFDHQENFPAKEALPEEGARVPCPDVDPGGSPRPQAPPPEGAPAPDTRARAVKTKYRLRHSADFRAVRAERKGAGDEVLRVRVRANSVGHPRFGIVVTKRLGGAVVRNRLRRRLQAAAAAKLCSLGAYDLVLLPQPAAVAAGAGVLSGSLGRALVQVGADR